MITVERTLDWAGFKKLCPLTAEKLESRLSEPDPDLLFGRITGDGGRAIWVFYPGPEPIGSFERLDEIARPGTVREARVGFFIEHGQDTLNIVRWLS